MSKREWRAQRARSQQDGASASCNSAWVCVASVEARVWLLLLVLLCLGSACKPSTEAEAAREEPLQLSVAGSQAVTTNEAPPGAATEAEPLPFHTQREGLAREHVELLPFFESRVCTPATDGGRPICALSRLYSDGARYILGDERDPGGKGRWLFLTLVRAEAFPEFEAFFAATCDAKEFDPARKRNGSAQQMELRVNAKSCRRVLAVDFDSPRFAEAKAILTRHSEPVTGQPRRVHAPTPAP